jgi:PAS domain-containing protein
VRLTLPPNPVLFRAAIVLFSGTVAFLLGVIFMRMLRKKIRADADLTPEAPTSDALPLHLYNTVIQQLKQQKHELHVQSKAEQHRARVSETFSQAVLSNLSSGVLVFGPNGLVKSTNPAAKQILGFASATGMSAKDIFRSALVSSTTLSRNIVRDSSPDKAAPEQVRLADEVEAVLREGSGRRRVEAEYETPAGAQRFIAVTISPVPTEDGSLLGAACVINDVSEAECTRRELELHRELSAEKALQLRNSLATISGYARQLAGSHDLELAGRLAADIAHEAEDLDRSIGSFLQNRRSTQSHAAVGSQK